MPNYMGLAFGPAELDAILHATTETPHAFRSARKFVRGMQGIEDMLSETATPRNKKAGHCPACINY